MTLSLVRITEEFGPTPSSGSTHSSPLAPPLVVSRRLLVPTRTGFDPNTDFQLPETVSFPKAPVSDLSRENLHSVFRHSDGIVGGGL